ncbi:methylase [EBPR siphovirus 2]|nr:methylase [EBPR siphovirus 2]
MTAFYNEIDPNAAAWLRELIARDLIAPGVVDERDIRDIRPDELRDYTQCHWFAGIGVWSYALRRAGWPDDRPVWTGSCPCFPAGALVLTKRGYVEIQHVIVGDEVLTHKARWRRVTRIGTQYGSTLTLKGQGHPGLGCTPDHPFLVGPDDWAAAKHMQGRRWATVAAVPEADVPKPNFGASGYFFDASLRRFRVKGDKDGKPVYLGAFKDETAAIARRAKAVALGEILVRGADAVDVSSLGFARFLGYWIGDGWTSGGSVTICGSRADSVLLSEIMSGAGLRPSVSMERTSARARCGSLALCEWLTEHFGAGAANKRIPAWLHGTSAAYREAFLSGYAEADGHAETTATDAKVQRFTTVSRALAIGVRVLLNQAGISASITIHTPNRHSVIEGREVSELPFYRVTAYENSRSFRFDGDHGWGYVRSIEPSLERRVYNLAVDGDESYTVDGIVVHNCQPFSAAGKGGGFADERHLWPAFEWLIGQCKPDVVLGEQVASKDGLNWIDLVLTDLEGQGNAAGAVDTCSAGHGAPHIRQRLRFASKRLGVAYGAGPFTGWEGAASARHGDSAFAGSGLRGLADPGRAGHERVRGPGEASGSTGPHGGETPQRERSGLADRTSGASGRLANAEDLGRRERSGSVFGEASADQGTVARQGYGYATGANGSDGGVADAERDGREVALFDGGGIGSAHLFGEADQLGMRGASALGLASADGGHAGAEREQRGGEQRFEPQDGVDGRLVNDRRREFQLARPGPTNGFWRDADWLRCRDARWRPVEPGSFPLADGASFRMVRLRGYGNAVDAHATAAFVEAFLEAEEDLQRLRLTPRNVFD